MPIADLFAPLATPYSVGTGRNGRNNQQRRAIEAFRPADRQVGTVGTRQPASKVCSDCSDRPLSRSEQEKPSNSGPVPTVPTVPTTKCNAGDRCRTCGVELAWPKPVGVIFADGTAECMRCCDDEVERLLEAGRRAVESPDALADPAETMLHASVPAKPDDGVRAP